MKTAKPQLLFLVVVLLKTIVVVVVDVSVVVIDDNEATVVVLGSGVVEDNEDTAVVFGSVGVDDNEATVVFGSGLVVVLKAASQRCLHSTLARARIADLLCANLKSSNGVIASTSSDCVGWSQ